MKSILYHTLLIATSVVVVCSTYVVTSRASCAPCNFVGGGFPIIADCTATYSSACDISPYDTCQKDHCVYVTAPPNEHNVYSYGELCTTHEGACMKTNPHACTDKNGPP
jgi:hypothetical protein